jgi:CPA1 family monovalent cation:H+ antiporter
MTALEIISVIFATAALFGMISVRWLKLPITVGTMLLTVVASFALIAFDGAVPQIHQWALNLVHRINFESVILQGMLPLLLFAGAFLLDLDQLATEKLTVSLLSIIGTVASVFLVAALMFGLTGAGIPWMQCLIFGALISPTDPIAVLEMLRRVGVPRAIQAQLAGESLFNDGIGAVLFLTMIEVARGQAPTALNIGEILLLKAGGGVAAGLVAAWITSQLMRRVNAYQIDILFTIMLALGGYVLADVLHLSAPLEAVVAGIALRHFNRHQPKEHVDHESVDGFWELIDEIQNSVLFVLLGLEILAVPVNMPTLRAGLAAILSVNAVRLVAVAGLLGIVRLVQRWHRSSTLVLTWGGLRGGLSIALALSVPYALGQSWMLGATYLTVVFSIVVQGGSMDMLLRWRKGRIARAKLFCSTIFFVFGRSYALLIELAHAQATGNLLRI